MEQISIKESKEIQVNILKYIDAVCKNNNISYSLAYGTMLGAVRHKGFIPWDDDIDICLLREEYDKLLGILKHDSNVNLITKETKNNYYSYAKVCDPNTFQIEEGYPEIEELGVFVDIFPIDNIPGNKIKRFFYAKLLYLFDRLIYTSVKTIYFTSTSLIKTIIKFILFTPLALVSKIIGTKNLVYKTEKLMLKYKNANTRFVGFLPNKYGYKEAFPMEIFDRYSTYEFEGYMLMGISDYDSYLKMLYGDYMQLPPEEKRITNHVFTSFWRT